MPTPPVKPVPSSTMHTLRWVRWLYEPGLNAVERPEPSDVHAGLVHHRDEGTIERLAAEGVEQHAHAHAGARSAERCSANSVPMRPFQ